MKLHTLWFLAAASCPVFAADPNSLASQLTTETPNNLVGLGKFEIPTFEMVKLDQKPVIKSSVAPQYPSEMRRARIEGEVLVDFVVTSEGKVVKASAVRSSHRDFEAAAVAAVNRWKFSPGMKSGRPVNTHMQVPIGFSLN